MDKQTRQAFIIKQKKQLNLIGVMVERNIKNTYRGSMLGVLWTVLNPLLTMSVLAFVYSKVFGTNMIEMKYPVYVLSGLIMYSSFFRGGTIMGLPSIVNNRGLVEQTQIPITAYPRVATYTSLVNFLFSFVALVIVMLIYKQPFKWTLLLIFVDMAPLLLLTIGTTYIVSTIYVFFRDIKNIYAVLTQLLMYLTPIFYTMDRLNNDIVVKLLKFNPMYYFVDYFRLIIIGQVPSISYHLVIFGMGIAFYALGTLIITQNKRKIILGL